MKKLYKFYIFHLTWPKMTLDLGTWPLTSLTNKGTPIASLTQIWFQSDFDFSKDIHPNNKNQHFPPNLTSHDPWHWYMAFDIINIWRNPYCIFDPSLVVIRLQLFKGDPNNENLTKLEHTHTYIHTYTYTYTSTHWRNSLLQYPPYCLSSQGDKKENRVPLSPLRNTMATAVILMMLFFRPKKMVCLKYIWQKHYAKCIFFKRKWAMRNTGILYIQCFGPLFFFFFFFFFCRFATNSLHFFLTTKKKKPQIGLST